MEKRSAMAIAAGLVVALLTGAVALSLGSSGSDQADASSERLEPRVRTVHRTVTLHREAKVQDPETVTTVTAGSSSSASDDQEYAPEDEGFEDEGFEDESNGEEHETEFEVEEEHEDGEDD